MTTKFPAEIDQFDNPQPNDSQAQARTHSDQHGDANDAIEAVQRKVGVNGSEDPDSLDFRIRQIGDVTDTLGSAAFEPVASFATAAQGGLADSAIQPQQLTEATDAINDQISTVETGLQSEIDALSSGQQTSAIYANTLTDLQAVPGTFVGQGGFVLNGSGAGQYRWDGSAWQFLRADMLALKADKAVVAVVSADVDDLKEMVTVTETPVASVVRNDTYPAAANITAYAAGFAPAGKSVNAMRFWMERVQSMGPITLALYRRATGASGAMPPGPNDTLLTTLTVDGSALATSDAWQEIEFRLPQSVVATGTDLLLWKLSSAGNLSIGRKNDASSSTQYGRGWFTQGGTDQLVSAPNQLAYAAIYRDVQNALTPTIQALTEQGQLQASEIAQLQSLTTDVSSAINDPTPYDTVFSGASNFNRWAVGFTPKGGMINRVRAHVDYLTTVHRYVLRLWARPNASSYVGPPSAADGDQLLATNEILASQYPQTDAAQDIDLSFDAVGIPGAATLIVDIEALTSAGARARMGLARINSIGGLTQIQRGYYRQGAGGMTALAAPGATVVSAFYDDLMVSADKVQGLPSTSYLLDRYQPTFAGAGMSVNVGGTAYVRNQRVPLNGSVTLDAAATGTQTVNDYPLQYFVASTIFTSNPNPWLGRRHISNVSAVRSSDSAVLVLGTDFAYHVNGKLRGLVDTPIYNVNTTFNYARERYDLIQIDPQTMAISVKKGVERDFDAIEYRPAADAGRVVLAYCLVVGATVQVIAAADFEGGVIRKGSEGDWQYLLQHNRRALASLRGKVGRGEAITVASYGDSIVAVQLGDPPYTANSAVRDRPENYLINMPADTVAALPKFDFGDGAGQVHVKISSPWSLIAALERATGQPAVHLNFGRGGSTSANTQHNGLWPARLQPVLDSGADVLLLHFGMNELGQASTLANIKSIAAQAHAVGMDVVVMSVPRRNAVDGPSLSGWNYTNTALWLSAVEAGAAFAPQHWIASDDQLGGIGASADSLGAAALFNHPGPAEFARYGQVLVQSVLG